ncbi:hypothetical protein PMAYCL1PPCAC_28437 [Pristionchus mayeri]|uniref:Uncharacterized protein n=1 Tax=Pristionchus mayeri TaxID=1317129 RepID=A0AAN5IA02_9BILA|nr:hypothetical protein PMAYCL1PPCAC_28437 [Pristionchus mayeri]
MNVGELYQGIKFFRLEILPVIVTVVNEEQESVIRALIPSLLHIEAEVKRSYNRLSELRLAFSGTSIVRRVG